MYPFYVSILVQKRAARLDVATEESSREQGYAHHLGSGKTDLGVVVVAYCLEELVAEVVRSDYGIVHRVLPVRRRF
jgi:hypothetical protein